MMPRIIFLFKAMLGCCAVLFLNACGPAVQTVKVAPITVLEGINQNVIFTDSLSPESAQAVRMLGISEAEALQNQDMLGANPSYQTLFSPLQKYYLSSELALGRAQQLERAGSAEALYYFIRSAEYGLAGMLLAECQTALESQCTGLKLFYARAVFGAATHLKTHSWSEQAGTIVLPGSEKPTEYYVGVDSRFEKPASYNFIELSANIGVEGLTNRFRRNGLGVALTACREKRYDDETDRFIPRVGTCVPLSAVITFPHGACTAEKCHASLELHNSLRDETVAVAGKRVQLQADFTAPFGKFLENVGIGSWDGFFSAFSESSSVEESTGFYTVEPYDPKKIPLVTIHGLFSNPATWLGLHNDLMGDPELRSHYQIWHYLYPTNLPILLNAENFRKNLDELHGYIQQQQRGAVPPKIVAIAHSMGGILLKTAVVTNSDPLLDFLFGDKSRVRTLDAKTQEQVREVLDFSRKPYINRIIFVAVPHRGSEISENFVGKMGRMLISLPEAAIARTGALLGGARSVLRPEVQANLDDEERSSVKGLSPKNPVLQGLAQIAVDEHIPFHSIIGARDLASAPIEVVKQSSDGVVPYTSSHLEGAESELLVPAEHNAHGHPLAVNEIKRILHHDLSKRSEHSARGHG